MFDGGKAAVDYSYRSLYRAVYKMLQDIEVDYILIAHYIELSTSNYDAY